MYDSFSSRCVRTSKYFFYNISDRCWTFAQYNARVPGTFEDEGMLSMQDPKDSRRLPYERLEQEQTHVRREKCKLCKECVLIVGEEQMQENDNQASISEAPPEEDVNSSIREPDDRSDTPLPGTDPEPAWSSLIYSLPISHGVRHRFRNHDYQHEWCAVEVPELRR